jgi:hypothetical protein
VHDEEFQGYMHEFLRRVDQYYKIVPIVPNEKEPSGTNLGQKDE